MTYRTILKMVCALLLSVITQVTLRADVNVLIVGSEYDTTDSPNDYWWDCNAVGSSRAFSAIKVRTELTNILSNAGLGAVNVQLEERYHWEYHTYYDHKKDPYNPGTVYCFNLESWFRWPYPAGVEASTRWPNLRGESTQWDYVILIGDPYTIEYQPGVYAQGVASIAAEVAKGVSPAEVVLLMPWPVLGSDSTVEHYEEVVYRVGRSGGHKVAPAGLAWLDLKGASRTNPNPDNDGAYIAAASLYSRIWGQSASASSYTYTPGGDAMADAVYTVVTNSIEAQHYTGTFDFQSPYKMHDDRRRQVSSTFKISSTEDGLHKAAVAAEERCRVDAGGNRAWRIERDDGIFGISYLGFGFVYQNNTSASDLHLAEISRWDLGLAGKMINLDRDNLRPIPRRFMWAQFHQEYPTANPMGGSPHISDDALRMSGTYIYTLFSGRCPVDPKPDPVTPQWVAEKIGYETAWRMGRCQTRAPGFKVMPSSATLYGVSESQPETMTVRFILPPQQDVVVNVSISDTSAATVSPAMLTFTPENYHTPQQVVVTAKTGAATATPFHVGFNTVSDDEVYNALNDSWSYFVSASPVVTLYPEDNPVIMDDGAVTASTVVTADAFDADGDALSYSWTKVSGPGFVAFSSTTVTNPTVTFSEAGNYILRCGVSDTYTPAVHAEIAIDVRPETIVLRDPESPADTLSGNVEYELYDGLADISTVEDLGAASGGALLGTGLISYFRFRGIAEEEEDQFGYIYRGYIDVPESGLYTFSLNSCGGSVLWIGNTEVVDNDGSHNLQEKSGAIGLKRGKHAITVKYFFNSAASVPVIEAYWAGPGMDKQTILWDVLYHVSPTPVDDVPIAEDQYVTTLPDTATNITIVATDADGDSVAYILESQPANGTLSGTAPDLTYTPDSAFSGSDSFTFKATDGSHTSSIATVEIAVTTPPVAYAGANRTVALLITDPKQTSASGGTVTSYVLHGTNYTTHTFTTVGANTLTFDKDGDVEYLVVGGGGAGGNSAGVSGRYGSGGGGAGGLLTNLGGTLLTVAAGDHTVTVGAGGAAPSASGDRGGSGGNSSVFGVTAIGGGGGSGGDDSDYALSGGSGGGGANGKAATKDGAAGTAGHGNKGGNGGTNRGGGGGGAGQAGFDSVVSSTGVGGAGLQNAITGTSVWYAGGGSGNNAASGALGGGGAPNGAGTDGLGGGGGCTAKGGRGIAIVRYIPPSVAVTLSDAEVSDADAGDTATPSWSVVSHPGTSPMFANPNILNPTVTFTAVGAYVLRLTASDNYGATGTNEVTITVGPAAPNTPPVAYAGTNRTVVLGASAPWSPSNIVTAAWYDASDADTLTLNGSTVSVWQDKSGNGNDATQGDSAKQPTTGGMIGTLNALSFDADILNTALTQLTNVSIYYVADATLKPGNANNCPLGASSFFSAGGCFITLQDYNNPGDANHATFYGLPLDVSIGFLNGVNAATDHGFSPAIFSHSGTGLSTESLTYKIGTSQANEGQPYFGTIGEIIICPSEHDEATRQKIEGYLAHKWGIKASLPSDHPYKSAAPGTPSVAVTFSDASVSDADAGDTVSQSWTVVSHPGTAPTFHNSNMLNATATFNAIGTYELRLTATDGIESHSDEVTITVSAGLTAAGSVPYEWLAAWTNDYETAVTKDWDEDGFTTLQEYWSGTDPMDTGSYLHISGITASNGNIRLIWSHARVDSNIPPLRVQARTNLTDVNWQDVGTNAPVDGINFFEAPSAGSRFYRLLVPSVP